MNNDSLTLGRYIPYNSSIHRMDPRLKLFTMICMMVAIFLKFPETSPFMQFLMEGIIFIVILILMLIAHIGVGVVLKQLKALWFMMLLVVILNIFLIKTDNFNFGYFEVFNTGWYIYWDSIYQSAYIITRIFLMISITCILTATTKPLDLTYALEWYLAPLKVIHFPTHEIAMTISIALRFIPTLLDETFRIMKAQTSRGVDFKNGSLKEKVRAITSLIVPLFLSAFQRSEDLANAMESRGYDPTAKRTRYRMMHWRWQDTINFILTIIFLGSLITISVMRIDLIALIGGLF